MLKENQDAFSTYKRELLLWNEKFNLTAITNESDIDEKHFEDSLSLISVLPEDAHTLIDIGSGAGFPGIPLGIALPKTKVTLLEATNKKCTFLEHIVSTLGLQNVEVVSARAEEAGRHQDMREKFDVATGRAVAALPVLLEYALPLLKTGGLLIAQKDSSKEDFKEAENALETLGGKIESIQKTGSGERVFVLVRKLKPTPSDFPRLPGTPSKKPL